MKYPEKELSKKYTIFLCFTKAVKICSTGLEASTKYYLNILSPPELRIRLRKLLKLFNEIFYQVFLLKINLKQN